ncbi:hypothetical protein L873DRAFT_129269 [Choiromyces venosus 120613-1]|uniref:Uncharacterized protein n=1 Tax=Choiromyces venosus 120613-1 TaxID=1336337 RepID=A0A3N4J8N8_9PEZI|nr:hypothetical protein L873DRAFT_129269 [Choiromyces venosus 120613-1]
MYLPYSTEERRGRFSTQPFNILQCALGGGRVAGDEQTRIGSFIGHAVTILTFSCITIITFSPFSFSSFTLSSGLVMLCLNLLLFIWVFFDIFLSGGVKLDAFLYTVLYQRTL